MYRIHFIVFFSHEADYEDALVFAEERRERLPAVYNERRLFERPLPDLGQAELPFEADSPISSNSLINSIYACYWNRITRTCYIFVFIAFRNRSAKDEPNAIPNIAEADAEDLGLDFFDGVNTAMESIDDFNYENMDQEQLIPCNQRDPVVLLEQVTVKSNMFEGVYEADPANMYENEPIIENVDQLSVMKVEENATVKYEIIHDHNEVDYILDDSSPNKLGGVKRENSWHMDEVDDILEHSSLNEHRGFKRENSFHMDDAVHSSSGTWSINTGWNVTDSDFNCGSGADLTQSVDQSVSPRVDCKFEMNIASFGEENAIYVVDDISECAFTEIAIPSSSAISENFDNHTRQCVADGSNETAEHVNVTQQISNPADITEKADETTDGAGIAGAANIIIERTENDEPDASHTNDWKVAACNDQSDDDVLFIEPKEWPKAKTFEVNGIVKRENDRFSGDLPFSVKVCTYYVLVL